MKTRCDIHRPCIKDLCSCVDLLLAKSSNWSWPSSSTNYVTVRFGTIAATLTNMRAQINSDLEKILIQALACRVIDDVNA